MWGKAFLSSSGTWSRDRPGQGRHMGHGYQDGGKKSKVCTPTHLANVLASVFMGPSGPGTRVTNGSTGPTHRLQEGVWSLIVTRRKAEPLGWPLRGSLWFPKDGALNGRRKSGHSLWLCPESAWFSSRFPRGDGFWD